MYRKYLVSLTLASLMGLAVWTGSTFAEESAPPTDALAVAPATETAPAAAEEQPSDFSLSFDTTYNSKYVFRGFPVTPDPVFQHSITAAYKGLAFNVWGNMDTTDVNSYENQFNELDFTLSYSGSVGKFNYGVGGIFYDIIQTTALNTTEVFVSGGLDILTCPTLTVYQDVDTTRGTYMLLSFSHTFEDVWKPIENVAMSVSLGTTFGWGSAQHNEFYYGVNEGGWADATISLGLPFAIGEHITITPAIHWSALMDDDLSAAVASSDNFWAGLSMTFSF